MDFILRNGLVAPQEGINLLPAVMLKFTSHDLSPEILCDEGGNILHWRR